MTRRGALAIVGGIAGYLYGKPVAATQGQALNLILDSVEAIVIQYRGRRVVVSPHEILNALEPAAPFPMQMQMPPAPRKGQ